MSAHESHLRAYWESEVKKFLYARLDSIWEETPGNAQAIGTFLESLGCDEQELEWLALLHHLLRAMGAKEFLLDELPSMLPLLSRQRETQRVVDKKPRGRILWGDTFVYRLSRCSPQDFVVQYPSRTPDTPENRLLKHYVRTIADKAKSTMGASRGTALVSEILSSCEEMLSSRYLSDIEDIGEVTSLMLQRTARDRRIIYAQLYDLWTEYDKAVLNRDIDVIKDLLSKGWLSPQDEDSLFELYVLISVINALEDFVEKRATLDSIKFGLVRPGKTRTVAVINGASVVANVGFDESPMHIFVDFKTNAERSIYKQMVDIYGDLRGAMRRPDVTVGINYGGNPEVRLIVEIKNTPPRSSYASESVYKAIGYLKDFEAVWSTDQKPKVILAVPKGFAVSADVQSDWLAQDIVIISGDIRTACLEILEHLFPSRA
jgi:hypothetical protein